MPTRTERLAAPTFLGKLSKRNILHSRHDGHTLTKWLRKLKGLAKGWKAKDTIKQKTEFLASSMFLHRHGLVEERLEALSQNEIDTLANLLYLDWSKGKTALRLVKQLRKSCEQYTNGMPDSSDSPNTGEGFASASQTSQQDLFGFAKRRKSGAPNTSSEDEPDAEPQDDTPGGTWCREPSKEKSPAAKTRRSSRAEQVSFSPHLRTTKTQNRTSTTGQGREREFSGKSPSPARSALPAPSKSHRGTKETPRLSTDKVEREKSTPNKRPDEIR